MLTKTCRICFPHLVKCLHPVECLVPGRQVLAVLQGLDHHQLVAHLVQAMDLATITVQVDQGLDTVVLVIPVVALDTMDLNAANMQALEVLGILVVDNMVATLEVSFHQVLRTLDTPLVPVDIHLVVLEVHRRVIHPPAILLVVPLEEHHLVLTQGLEEDQEHHPLLLPQGLHLQGPTRRLARLQLIQPRPHHPQRPPHPRQPPPPLFHPLPTHLLLRLLSQDLRVLLPRTPGQQAPHHPTTPPPIRHMDLVHPLLVEQAQVVLAAQGKDSLVVILVGALLLLEATQVTLEDRVTHRQATLEVGVLQERLDPATLVGGPILHPKEVTHPTVILREDLEVTHPQVRGIPTDLQAVRWVRLEVMLLGQGVPHPPKGLYRSRCKMKIVYNQLYIFGTKDLSLQLSIKF